MTGEDFTTDGEKDKAPKEEIRYYDSLDILNTIQKAWEYPQKILENFILKYNESQDNKLQQKLADENNRQREIVEFRKVMEQFYTWSAQIVNDKINIVNEHRFPEHIKKEIITVIKERQEADGEDLEDEDDGDFVVPQKLNEYTDKAKEVMDKELYKFGLKLREKYRVEEDKYDNNPKFYPLLYIIDVHKFINLLTKIQNNEDNLGSFIYTILSGFKDQLAEGDRETMCIFQKEIPQIRKELQRIGLRDEFNSERYENILQATEKWYLKDMIDLEKLWFNIDNRCVTNVYADYQDLPIFIQEMLDIIAIDDETRGVDDVIDFGSCKTELIEAIQAVKKIKKHTEIFCKARSDLLLGLTFVLEELSKSKVCPKELIPEIKSIYKEILDM